MNDPLSEALRLLRIAYDAGTPTPASPLQRETDYLDWREDVEKLLENQQ